jgi:hypothetical protein
VYAHEVHAYEVHAHEVHAREVHVHKVHAREIRAHVVHTREMYAHEEHVYGGSPQMNLTSDGRIHLRSNLHGGRPRCLGI